MILFSSSSLVLRRTVALNPSSASPFQAVPQKLAEFFSSVSGSSSSNGNSDSKYYTVGLTGSTGMVGTALRDELTRRQIVNDKPVRIVRLIRSDQAEDKDLSNVEATDVTLQWNPKGSTAQDILSPTALASLDAIVHFSGENVATGLGRLGFMGLRPWTDAKKKEILDSRIVTTKALASAIASSPNAKTFLSASGIGVYGDHFIGNEFEAVDETAEVSKTSGFLAEVSRRWEEATTQAAQSTKNRVVNMRIGVVMSRNGGALSKLYPIFFLGGGGNVGSGNQYFSFISARDIARAMVHTLETPQLSGPVNLCSPQPCTNAEFTQALGKALN